MTIEIKITGADAATTVAQLQDLNSFFSTTTAVKPVESAPTPQAVKSSEPASTPQATEDDEEESKTYDITKPDARGFVWDERIHSSNQKQTAKGVWQAKRNVDPELVKQVEAELSAPPAPPASQLPTDPPPPAEPASQLPTDPPPPVESAPAPAAEQSIEEQRKLIQGKIPKLLQACKTHDATAGMQSVQAIMASKGVSNITQFADADVPSVLQLLDRIIADPANAVSIANGLM